MHVIYQLDMNLIIAHHLYDDDQHDVQINMTLFYHVWGKFSDQKHNQKASNVLVTLLV